MKHQPSSKRHPQQLQELNHAQSHRRSNRSGIMKWLRCSEGSTTSTNERSTGDGACCMGPQWKRNQNHRPRLHNFEGFLCAFFIFREIYLIELPKTLVQLASHKTNTSTGRHLQYTKNYRLQPTRLNFPFNVHTLAVNTLQEDTATPGKAAVADSDNSSMTAVYQAAVEAAGTPGVGN